MNDSEMVRFPVYFQYPTFVSKPKLYIEGVIFAHDTTAIMDNNGIIQQVNIGSTYQHRT